MKNPIIMINFKTYKQGKQVLDLAKKIEKFSKNIIIGVQATDCYFISLKTKLPVFVQHVDFMEPGRNTGFILPEAVKAVGAKGVFLNHSEHRINFKDLEKTIKRCKKVNLQTAVFAKNFREAFKVKKLNPDYLIVEPPRLVAGDISVSKAKPYLIKKISEKLNRSFLVGAGIKTKEDVIKAINLGAGGVVISSAITKSRNPEKKLKELFLGVGNE